MIPTLQLHLNRLQDDFICDLKGPERELLQEPRWPGFPMVLHYRPKSPDNVLHQHPSMRRPKQACQW